MDQLTDAEIKTMKKRIKKIKSRPHMMSVETWNGCTACKT